MMQSYQKFKNQLVLTRGTCKKTSLRLKCAIGSYKEHDSQAKLQLELAPIKTKFKSRIQSRAACRVTSLKMRLSDNWIQTASSSMKKSEDLLENIMTEIQPMFTVLHN